MTLQSSKLEECRPYRDSYWQLGFKDATEGRREVLPTKNGPLCLANRGYLNGYHAGMQKRVLGRRAA